MPIDARHGLVWCGYAFALASMAYSLISAFATRRIFDAAPPNREALPPVTILKPLCGAEPETYECLRSFCEQPYAEYQVIFGVCDPQDPAVAVVAPAAAIFSATAAASTLIHLNARRPGASTTVLLLVPFRDLLHFGLWIWSFATRRVQWGDDHYEVSRDGAAQPVEGLGQ